jgi:hypothetical protein
MVNTVPPDATDDWGQTIVNLFMRNGGFGNPRSVRVAHRLFLRLVRRELDLETASWDLRCDALATWALICIELRAPRADLDELYAAIALAQERLPSGTHPQWLGQLAFDLVCARETATPWELQQTGFGLFDTLRQATVSSLDHEEPGATPLRPDKWLTPAVAAGLFRGPWTLDPHQLTETKRLLLRLRADGVSEASCVLVILGIEPNLHARWLDDSARGPHPTCQLALLYRGLLQDAGEVSRRGPRHSLKTFEAIVFPEADDPDYYFLSSIALKAKAKCFNQDHLWRYSQHVALHPGKRTNIASAAQGTSRVVRQWGKVQTVWARALEIKDNDTFHDADEIDAACESVAMQTAKLVEVFLKWCLAKWPIDDASLNSLTRGYTATFYDWTIDGDYSNFVGRTLGNTDPKLTLLELLECAGPPITSGETQDVAWIFVKAMGRLKTRRTGDGIMRLSTQFRDLIIANAMAARCCRDHLFRTAPTELLREAFGGFGGAYKFRNKEDVAHYSPISTGRNEALFWGDAVCRLVSRLLSCAAYDAGARPDSKRSS